MPQVTRGTFHPIPLEIIKKLICPMDSYASESIWSA